MRYLLYWHLFTMDFDIENTYKAIDIQIYKSFVKVYKIVFLSPGASVQMASPVGSNSNSLPSSLINWKWNKRLFHEIF